MVNDYRSLLEVGQFFAAVLGVLCGARIVYQYFVDLSYAAKDATGDPRRLVAWSNVRRESLALFSQFLLLSVGATYWIYHDSPPWVILFRQSCLFIITSALALKSGLLIIDRFKLVKLLDDQETK